MTAIPIGNEFTLATTARRYQESLNLPTDSATRALRAFEYITCLEDALHGSSSAVSA